MKLQRLGKRGPVISVVGFGAWEAGGDEWGPNPPVEQVVDAIRSGLEAGINWVDTAEVYGDGTSEDIVGQALQGIRERVVVATKVGPAPEGTGFARDQVPEACRKSLKRLGTEWIDLYQLHWPDDTGVPLDETWGAMAGLVDEGLVRWIGVSNFDRRQIETCIPIRHVDALQPHFSMLHLGNRELIRWCDEHGIGVVAYGPLGYGLLTGAIGPDTTFDERDWRSGNESDEFYERLFAPGKIEQSLAVVDELREIAGRFEITVAQLALAWTFHQPGVTSAIAGSRNPEHVRQNAAAGNVELDPETLRDLEDVIRLGPEFSHE